MESEVPELQRNEHRMRIFILDDQPGVAENLALGLRAAGQDATGFIDVDLALARIQEADVLVTDYHLPKTTGLEVVRRAYDQGWRGGVLLTTNYPRQIRESLDHPLIRMGLVKPIDAEDLIDALVPIRGENTTVS